MPMGQWSRVLLRSLKRKRKILHLSRKIAKSRIKMMMMIR